MKPYFYTQFVTIYLFENNTFKYNNSLDNNDSFLLYDKYSNITYRKDNFKRYDEIILNKICAGFIDIQFNKYLI